MVPFFYINNLNQNFSLVAWFVNDDDPTIGFKMRQLPRVMLPEASTFSKSDVSNTVEESLRRDKEF